MKRNSVLVLLILGGCAAAATLNYQTIRREKVLAAMNSPDGVNDIIVDCRPGDGTAAQFYPYASYIFSGIVTDSASEKLTVEPKKIWKGSIDESIISIIYKGKIRHRNIVKGSDYIFFLGDQSNAPYSLHYCDHTEPAQNLDTIEYLEQHLQR